LGAGAIADQDDTVSVGHGGAGSIGSATRRITNVTAGVDDTDAVNMSQLNAETAALAAANATLQTNIDAEESARIAGDAAIQTVVDTHAGQIGELQTLTTAHTTRLNAIDALNNVQDNRLTSLESQTALQGNRITALEAQLPILERQINGGVAAAMALGGTVMPPDTNFAVSFNLATYRGEQGFSASAVARVSDKVWVSGGFTGSSVKGSTGGRVGITFGM
jgi:autotransporter adhesin